MTSATATRHQRQQRDARHQRQQRDATSATAMRQRCDRASDSGATRAQHEYGAAGIRPQFGKHVIFSGSLFFRAYVISTEIFPTVISVRHQHRFAEIKCLTPGQALPTTKATLNYVVTYTRKNHCQSAATSSARRPSATRRREKGISKKKGTWKNSAPEKEKLSVPAGTELL